MKFNGIRSDQTRGKRLAQTGCTFEWTNGSTITMTPDGIDGTAQVVISGTFSSTTSTIRPLRLTGSLVCNMSSSGAGGLDTGSKTADKGYYIFVIAKQNSAWTDPLLLSSLSDTSPTMPSGYTYRSNPIWFTSVDDSNTIRSAVGVSANMFTTIGPLSFTVAQSLSKDSNDETETFNFRLGTSF